jgi:hypothetical protein
VSPDTTTLTTRFETTMRQVALMRRMAEDRRASGEGWEEEADAYDAAAKALLVVLTLHDIAQEGYDGPSWPADIAQAVLVGAGL